MDDKKMMIIQQLMDELKDEMEPGQDDLDSRLGRKDPKVAMMSISKGPMDPLADKDDMPPLDDHSDGEDKPGMLEMMGMGKPDDSDDMPMSPDDELKARLMKMRG